jgi:uncharacterized membrane protein
MPKGNGAAALDDSTKRIEAGGNRSAILFGLASILSLVGLADAIYLTVKHLSGESVRCTVVSGCEEVLGSSYATVAGYPLAAFGALAYFISFSLSLLAAFGYRMARPLLAFLVAMMFIMTLWLLYVQKFILEHFCQYCLLSAAMTICLTVIVVVERFGRSE